MTNGVNDNGANDGNGRIYDDIDRNNSGSSFARGISVMKLIRSASRK